MTVLLGCLVAIGPAALETGRAAAADPIWERVTAGLMATLWKPALACPGIPPMLMLQIDPERFRFAVHHYRDEGLETPPTVEAWQRRTDAHIVFNAGLFRADYSYLGLLIKEGRFLAGKRHHSWQGIFAAEPTAATGRKARVLDLAFDVLPDEDRAFPYREAAQSLMLLDRTGKPRVRQTGKRANQTIVAEDGEGKIVVMKSSAPAPLYELAECLRDAQPHIRQAMAMDGGSSSELVASPDVLNSVPKVEKHQEWRTMLEGGATHHIGLPAVITVAPRAGPAHRPLPPQPLPER